MWEAETEGSLSQVSPGKVIMRLDLKKKTTTKKLKAKGWCVPQVLEYLPTRKTKTNKK
jgi:hypothetical protein